MNTWTITELLSIDVTHKETHNQTAHRLYIVAVLLYDALYSQKVMKSTNDCCKQALSSCYRHYYKKKRWKRNEKKRFQPVLQRVTIGNGNTTPVSRFHYMESLTINIICIIIQMYQLLQLLS